MMELTKKNCGSCDFSSGSCGWTDYVMVLLVGSSMRPNRTEFYLQKLETESLLWLKRSRTFSDMAIQQFIDRRHFLPRLPHAK